MLIGIRTAVRLIVYCTIQSNKEEYVRLKYVQSNKEETLKIHDI